MNPNVADAETEPVERVRELEPGDKVLWGDRSVPLTVIEADVTVLGPSSRQARMVENQEQADGAKYVLVEQMTKHHPAKVRRVVVPSAMYPEGLHPQGYAEDLRRVVDD